MKKKHFGFVLIYISPNFYFSIPSAGYCVLWKKTSQMYMVKSRIPDGFRNLRRAPHKSLTTPIPIKFPARSLTNVKTTKNYIAHVTKSGVWGRAESNCGADHDSLSHCRDSVIINRNQGECFMHARTEQNTTHIIHTAKSLYPNSKRRERKSKRERDPIGVIGTKTLEIHTHTRREYSTHHVDYFYGGLSRLGVCEQRVWRRGAHTHTLTAAAAEEIVCWTQQQQQLFLAGRQQERKNAMALTEDGEEEDEGREREESKKKLLDGWLLAWKERERENNNIHSLASATLRGHFLQLSDSAADGWVAHWFGEFGFRTPLSLTKVEIVGSTIKKNRNMLIKKKIIAPLPERIF